MREAVRARTREKRKCERQRDRETERERERGAHNNIELLKTFEHINFHPSFSTPSPPLFSVTTISASSLDLGDSTL